MQPPRLTQAQKKKYKALFKLLSQRKSEEDDNDIESIHKSVFMQADCLACANCCKTHSPILLHTDMKRISKYLGISAHDFMSKYLLIDADEDWVFHSTPCPFLFEDNKCTIYNVRPKACMEYPHTDRKKLYKIAAITMKNAEICPAVTKILDQAEAIIGRV